MARNKLPERTIPFDVDIRRHEAMHLYYKGDPEGWRANHWRHRGEPSTQEAIRRLWLASLRYVRANRIPLRLHKRLSQLGLS